MSYDGPDVLELREQTASHGNCVKLNKTHPPEASSVSSSSSLGTKGRKPDASTSFKKSSFMIPFKDCWFTTVQLISSKCANDPTSALIVSLLSMVYKINSINYLIFNSQVWGAIIFNI